MRGFKTNAAAADVSRQERNADVRTVIESSRSAGGVLGQMGAPDPVATRGAAIENALPPPTRDQIVAANDSRNGAFGNQPIGVIDVIRAATAANNAANEGR